MILTKSQGERLTAVLHAARPEWATASIAKILQTANQNEGLPAIDFNHALRAAIAYATACTPEGNFVKQTPGFIAEPSRFWEITTPPEAPQPERPRCQEHHWEPIPCRVCQDEINLGDRTPEMLNKRKPGLPLPPEQVALKAQRARQAIRQAQTIGQADNATSEAEHRSGTANTP
ncbi:hypothetical protein [Glutamicibacter sp. TV12E]|uniref:hypothetical protein n=1 Tax=Glutamicibacter sp. TV12E TaxID=3446362 RepID=UPI004034829E